jgi:rare lipoprotein A
MASADTVLLSRTGTASYYAAKFQGKHTSNGELLDNEAYTCASYLPYNTWIRVTHLRNGKSVVVRVTDRFRPGGKHLVDLTLRAAKEIDMVRYGVARIRMEVLNPDIIRAILPKDSVSMPLILPDIIVELPVQMPDIQVNKVIR